MHRTARISKPGLCTSWVRWVHIGSQSSESLTCDHRCTHVHAHVHTRIHSHIAITTGLVSCLPSSRLPARSHLQGRVVHWLLRALPGHRGRGGAAQEHSGPPSQESGGSGIRSLSCEASPDPHDHRLPRCPFPQLPNWEQKEEVSRLQHPEDEHHQACACPHPAHPITLPEAAGHACSRAGSLPLSVRVCRKLCFRRT